MGHKAKKTVAGAISVLCQSMRMGLKLMANRGYFSYRMSNVNFIFAQILGGMATLILCLSYVVKSKKGFLLLGLLGDIAYGMSFLFVGSWSAGAIALLSCLQFFFVYHYDKKNKKMPKSIALLFIVMFVGASVLVWNNAWDIIPLASYVWYTFALYLDNVKSIRVMYVLPNALLVVYDIMVMAYASAFEDGIEALFLTTMIVIDVVKMIALKKKKLSTLKALFENKPKGAIKISLQSTYSQIRKVNNRYMSKIAKNQWNTFHIPSFCKFSKVSYY